MWDRNWPSAHGSFMRPVPIPTSAPGDAPLQCLAVNAEWLKYALGALKQLMLPATWGDMRDPAVQAAQQAANDLIGLFAEASACGVDDLAGTYAEGCLAAPVTVISNTPSTVLSLPVTPGVYQLAVQASMFYAPGALHFTYRLMDGDTVLSEGEATSGNPNYLIDVSLTAKVAPSEDTTYTFVVIPAGANATVVADPPQNGSGAHVTTCLKAYPQGVTGPQGPEGPPGGPSSFRFTADCIMQYSTDSGVTWLDVAGWDANAPACFAGFHGAAIPIDEIDPGAPPNVQDVAPEQNACNIAAYLAQTVIRGAVNEAQRQATLTNDALDFGVALVALIPGIDLVMVGLAAGANALYQLVDGDNLADFTSAASDDALWSAVTCAIYGVIREDGEVTDANFGAVGAAIGGVTYTHTEVPTAMALFWAGLGVKAVRAAQIAGALEVADCSACATSGPWCTQWGGGARDMTLDWASWPGTRGCPDGGTVTSTQVTPASCGAGWNTAAEVFLPHPRTITTVRGDWSGGFGDPAYINLYDAAGTNLLSVSTDNWRASDGPGPIANVSRVSVEKNGGDTPAPLGSIKVGGPDFGSPWGENNGTCD